MIPGVAYLPRRLLQVVASLVASTLVSLFAFTQPASAFESSHVYWAATNDYCSGGSSCGSLITVAAWGSGDSRGEPYGFALDSKSTCDYTWNESGDFSYTYNGLWYAAVAVNIGNDGCGGSDGNWRLEFNAPNA